MTKSVKNAKTNNTAHITKSQS